MKLSLYKFRESRKINVVIYNLPEVDKDSVQDREQENIVAVGELALKIENWIQTKIEQEDIEAVRELYKKQLDLNTLKVENVLGHLKSALDH